MSENTQKKILDRNSNRIREIKQKIGNIKKNLLVTEIIATAQELLQELDNLEVDWDNCKSSDEETDTSSESETNSKIE